MVFGGHAPDQRTHLRIDARRVSGDSPPPVPRPAYFGPKFALNFALLDPAAPAAGPIPPELGQDCRTGATAAR